MHALCWFEKSVEQEAKRADCEYVLMCECVLNTAKIHKCIVAMATILEFGPISLVQLQF